MCSTRGTLFQRDSGSNQRPLLPGMYVTCPRKGIYILSKCTQLHFDELVRTQILSRNIALLNMNRDLLIDPQLAPRT